MDGQLSRNGEICGSCTFQNEKNAKNCVLCGDVLMPTKTSRIFLSADDILGQILGLNSGFEVPSVLN